LRVNQSGWELGVYMKKILGFLGWVLVTGCSTSPETASVALEGGSTTSTDEDGSPEAQPGEASPTMFGDAAPVGADDFFAQYGAAACKRLYDCPLPNNDDLGVRNVLGTEARCNQFVPELLRRISGFGDLFAAVAAGTIHFDASRAATCFSALRSCGAPLGVNQILACREMFEGTVPTNGACYVDQDCAGDAHCATPPDAGFQRTCPGSCQPDKVAGSPCFDDRDCSASKGFADCRFSDGGSTCFDFALAPEAAATQACGFLTAGTFTPCGSGMWCDAVNTATGTCRAALGNGATCNSGDDVCTVGLGCARQDGGTTCVPISVGTKVSDPCGPNFVSVCDPFSSLECVSGACASYGDGTEGSRCSNRDLGELTCQRGLVCGMTAVCMAPRKEGEACQRSGECASGTCGADHLCAARRCDSH
jgi:hypothetical protein